MQGVLGSSIFDIKLTSQFFVAACELDQDPVKFHSFFRMNFESLSFWCKWWNQK
jgi:hypothetical protein